MSQELACKRGGEAETDHPARESATRDSACFHRRDELSQFSLTHQKSPRRPVVTIASPRASPCIPVKTWNPQPATAWWTGPEFNRLETLIRPRARYCSERRHE